MKKLLSLALALALLLALAVPAHASGNAALDAILDKLSTALESSVGKDQFEVKTCGRLVIVSVWYSGVDVGIIDEAARDPSLRDSWSSMTGTVIRSQQDIQTALSMADDSVVLIYNIVDDKDHTLLLSVSEGAALYDVLALEKAPGAAAKAPAPGSSASAADSDGGLTMGQKNALASAKTYLKYSSFSRKGLIDQLKFEGYSQEDAEYAVDHVEVDWFEQAALSAETYLKYSSFSRQGLIDQLKFEGFTQEQAEYGVSQVGY